MLAKTAYFKLIDISTLNQPVLPDTVIDQGIELNKHALERTLQQIKIAETEASLQTKGIPEDVAGFDLEADIRAHPESLYVKCFAIKADEMNDNGDFFGYDELKKATPTFVGVPVFTNHQNTDVNQARGKIVHSWWDEERRGIMVIARVDSTAYPQLARGIKQDYITGTSMGCQVKYSLCSACHNYAENPSQYCSCIKDKKTRHLAVKKQQCQYHKFGNEKECPLCGSVKKNAKSFDYDGKVFEYNYGIKFIENSFVVNPACHDCGVTEVIDAADFLSKVADISCRLPGLLKAAQNVPVICDDKKCVPLISNDQAKTILSAVSFIQKGASYVRGLASEELAKLAGQEQINKLNQALDLLTSVSQDMLLQKDQLDLEFLSDLVTVLADLQTVTDELTEQGYGRLPSPNQQSQGEQSSQQTATVNSAPAAQPSTPPATGGASKVQSGPAGQVGTVTAPTASKKISLQKVAHRLMAKSKSMELLLKTTRILPAAPKQRTISLPWSFKKR